MRRSEAERPSPYERSESYEARSAESYERRSRESYNVPVRRDLVLVFLIAAAAFGIRTYPAWNNVFDSEGVNFLETDAWYHIRLIEHQVRNYPWRVTLDPFAAPGGQFVPVAPLFDTVTSTIVFVLHGRDADTGHVERVAAMMPPAFGALTVVALWALARRLFDRRAGLLAAALLAVLPGHFMDRTMLGFVDHHALEALLAIGVLLAFTYAVQGSAVAIRSDDESAGSRSSWSESTEKQWLVAGMMAPALAGVALGLYLLAWGSGAFLIAIIGAWLLALVPLARTTDDLARAARVTVFAAVVALVLVAGFQDARMHRYGSQILGLVGLAAAALAVRVTTARARSLPSRRALVAMVAVVFAVVAVVVAVFARGLFTQVLIDVGRLAPDPSRMGVLEARPLFLYGGEWSWSQPWMFFRTGFFIGLLALVPFAVRVWRRRAAAELLILVFAVAMFVATIGQNRFGYYLVTACALLGGWLAAELLDWGGVPHADNPKSAPYTRLPLAREVAVVIVAGGMFAPNLSPSILLAERMGSYPVYWRDTMQWLRAHTPPPFQQSTGVGEAYYYARYSKNAVPSPDYSIMSWWDQGYWITQQARRVPVANPTQERAPNAARFYSATDEVVALDLLRAERGRYVVSDYELPFRRLANGAIMGRFETILDWAGGSHARYYEVAYRRADGGWDPVWIFHEPYYRSMAFRLSALGGAAATPSNATTVITIADRVDTNGVRFREILTQETFATYEAARQAVDASAGHATIVGLDPWQSAVPIEPLQAFVEVYAARTSEQKPTEGPWVRVFEVR